MALDEERAVLRGLRERRAEQVGAVAGLALVRILLVEVAVHVVDEAHVRHVVHAVRAVHRNGRRQARVAGGALEDRARVLLQLARRHVVVRADRLHRPLRVRRAVAHLARHSTVALAEAVQRAGVLGEATGGARDRRRRRIADAEGLREAETIGSERVVRAREVLARIAGVARLAARHVLPRTARVAVVLPVDAAAREQREVAADRAHVAVAVEALHAGVDHRPARTLRDRARVALVAGLLGRAIRRENRLSRGVEQLPVVAVHHARHRRVTELAPLRAGSGEVERGRVVAGRAQHRLCRHQVRAFGVVVQDQDVALGADLGVGIGRPRDRRIVRGQQARLVAVAAVGLLRDRHDDVRRGDADARRAVIGAHAHQRVRVRAAEVVGRRDRDARGGEPLVLRFPAERLRPGIGCIGRHVEAEQALARLQRRSEERLRVVPEVGLADARGVDRAHRVGARGVAHVDGARVEQDRRARRTGLDDLRVHDVERRQDREHRVFAIHAVHAEVVGGEHTRPRAGEGVVGLAE
ncbi:MAG: hypothetical protein NTV21_11045 [Planctomycetota bacterium]|nr:hypothetical protein [Planctomycetota bacterium]